jgi:hypothetical protein
MRESQRIMCVSVHFNTSAFVGVVYEITRHLFYA